MLLTGFTGVFHGNDVLQGDLEQTLVPEKTDTSRAELCSK